MEENKSSRIFSVVFLRGFASLAVCLVHIQLLSNAHFGRIVDYLILNGQQGVAVFFVISGFVLTYSLYKRKYKIENFFSFLLIRSIRIDPPYWVTIALIFILTTLPISLLNFNEIVFHIFYLIPFIHGAVWYSGIFWTLSIEFQFYLLLGLCYPFLMRINSIFSLMIIICISIFSIRFQFTYRGIIISNFYDFAVGYIVFLIYIKTINLTNGLILLVAFSAYITQSVSIITGVVPFLTSLFILFVNTKSKLLPLYFLGEISYSLYLVHFPVSYFFVRETKAIIANEKISFFGALSLSIGSAYIFYLLIEKPSLRFSKRIGLNMISKRS